MSTETVAAGPGLCGLIHDEDEDLRWQDQALCAQTDPEAFFPDKGGSTREAKQICGSCEVRAECLGYALEHNEMFGIWGGLSERERRQMKRTAGNPPPAPAGPGGAVTAAPAKAKRALQLVPAEAPRSPQPEHDVAPGRPDPAAGARPAPQEKKPAPSRPRPAPAAAQPSAELTLAERCRRRDLGPVERAEAMGLLLRQEYTVAGVAQRAGLAVSTVSYYLALLDLDQRTREKVRAGQLAVADAVAAVRAARKLIRETQGAQLRTVS